MDKRYISVFMSLSLSAAFCAPVRLSAQDFEKNKLSSTEAFGTVGTYRIGLNYTVRQNTEFVVAHYFYVSQSKNIPITGTILGESVHLVGADGSDFKLHFVGNGREDKEPLTFYNSVGLRGSWTLGSRELPVSLTFNYGTGNPGEPYYSQVTTRSDAAFEAMVKAAKDAIVSGDPAATSQYIHFPLEINVTGHRIVIRNPNTLKKHWSTIFTTALLSKLRNDSTHEMFVRNGEAMLGDGELWFDDKGLVSVNPLLTPTRSR